jgi:hypothetical protein
MSKWVNTGGAETGDTARRYDVVLPVRFHSEIPIIPSFQQPATVVS